MTKCKVEKDTSLNKSKSTGAAKSNTKPLTPREAAFVREYLLSGNQTDAYIAAGYSPKSARANATRMMEKESVSAAIAAGHLGAEARNSITIDDLVREYTHLALTGMSRFVRIVDGGQPVVDFSKCTPADLNVISEITVETYADGNGQDARQVKRVKIKTYDRYQALSKLANFLGMFVGNKTDGGEDTLSLLLKDIMERGSELRVRPQGPLGSKKPDWKN